MQNSSKLEKKLNEKIFPKFNTSKEWSDLVTTNKLLKEQLILLTNNDNFNLLSLKDKQQLARRLTQSLSSSHPSGLHEITLEIYDILLSNFLLYSNFQMKENMLFLPGLFTFFETASLSNKLLFISTLLQKHLFKLNIDDLKTISFGIILSMLPCLDEQNETLTGLIKENFKKLRILISDSCFYYILWSLILNNQRNKLCGLKYLNESIPGYRSIQLYIKYYIDNDKENMRKMNILEESEYLKIYNETKDISQSNEEEKIIVKIINRNFFPNISTLVVNTLSTILEEGDYLSQRTCLDLIISKFPINNLLLSEESMICLITSSFHLLIKIEYSTVKRLIIWLLDKYIDEENIDCENLYIKSMSRLLISSLGRLIKNRSFKFCLLIMQQLIKEQVNFSLLLTKEMAILIINQVEKLLIDNIQKVSQNRYDDLFDFQNFTEPIRKYSEFDKLLLDLIWEMIEKKIFDMFEYQLNSENNDECELIKENQLKRSIYNNENNENYVKSLENLIILIEFFINNELIRQDYDMLYVQLIKIIFILYEYKIKSNTSNLLISTKVLNCISLLIDLIEKRKSFFNKTIKKKLISNHKISFDENSNDCEFVEGSFYIEKIRNLIKNDVIIKKCVFNIKEILLNIPYDMYNSRIELGNYMFKSYLYIVDTVSYIIQQLDSNEYDKYNTKSNENNNQISKSLETSQKSYLNSIKMSLHDLFKGLINNNSIKINILPYIFDIQYIISCQLMSNIIPDCLEMNIEHIISFLWDSITINTSNIIYPYEVENSTSNLNISYSIIYFHYFFQNITQKHIISSLTSSETSTVKSSILKFIFIWDMGKTIIDNSYVSFFTTNNDDILLLLIDFLNSIQPFIKLTIKKWIVNSLDRLTLIINPLLKYLLSHKYFLTKNKELYIIKEYEYSLINDIFKKLEMVLVTINEYLVENNSTTLVNFLFKLYITDDLNIMNNKNLVHIDSIADLEQYVSLYYPSEGCDNNESNEYGKLGIYDKNDDDEQIKNRDINYYELIFTISLRLIRGVLAVSYIPSLKNENLYIDAQSIVSSSASKFLIFLLNKTSNINILLQLGNLYIEQIVSILVKSFINKNKIMIMNIVSILNILLFQSMNSFIQISQNMQNNTSLSISNSIHNTHNIFSAYQYSTSIDSLNKSKKYYDGLVNFLKTENFQDCLLIGIRCNEYESEFKIDFFEKILPLLKVIFTEQEYNQLGNKLVLCCIGLFSCFQVNESSELKTSNNVNDSFSILNKLDVNGNGSLRKRNEMLIYHTLLRDEKIFLYKNFSENDEKSKLTKQQKQQKNEIIILLRCIIYNYFNIYVSIIKSFSSKQIIKFSSVAITKSQNQILLKDMDFSQIKKRIEYLKDSNENLIDDYDSLLINKNSKILDYFKNSIKYKFFSDKFFLSNELISCIDDILLCLMNEYNCDMNLYIKDPCLSMFGMIKYSEDEVNFLLYNSNLFISSSKNESTSLSISSNIHMKSQKNEEFNTVLSNDVIELNQLINNFILNIYISFPLLSIKSLFNLWSLSNKEQYSNLVYKQHINNNIKLKIIENLLILGLPLESIICSLLKITPLARQKDYKKGKIKNSEGIYPYILSLSVVHMENSICSLLYSLLQFNITGPFNLCLIQEVEKFILMLIESKSPSTIIYLLEILSLLIIKSNSQLLLNDKQIKKQLLTVFNVLYNRINEFSLLSTIDYKVNSECYFIFTDSTFSHYSNIGIEFSLPPTFYTFLSKIIFSGKYFSIINSKLYLLMKNEESKSNADGEVEKDISKRQKMTKRKEVIDEKRKNENNGNSNKTLFALNVFEAMVNKKIMSQEEFISLYKIIGLITLNENLTSILKGLYPSSDKQDKLSIFLSSLLKEGYSLMKTLYIKINTVTPLLIYTKQYALLLDLIVDLIYNITSNLGAIAVDSSYKDYLEVLYDLSFFGIVKSIDNKKIKEIVHQYALYRQVIIDELIDQIHTQSSFFGKSNEREKTITKSIRTLLFILISSPKDCFSSKISIIMEKLKEMIMFYSGNNPVMENEILLFIRVVLFKFKYKESVSDIFKHLCPAIFCFIYNILKGNYKSHPNLVFSALKLVEYLSYNQDFSYYQWYFFSEDMNFQVLDGLDGFELGNYNQMTHNNDGNVGFLKKFKPLVLGLIEEYDTCFDLVNYISINSTEYIKKTIQLVDDDENKNKNQGNDSYNYIKNRVLYDLILNSCRVNSWEELINETKKLIFKFGFESNFKKQVNESEIEKLLQEEIINI